LSDMGCRDSPIGIYGMSRRSRSLGLRTGNFHDLRPFISFLADELGELGRRGCICLITQVGDPHFQSGIGKTGCSSSERSVVVTASARNLPALMCSIELTIGSKATCTCPPIKIGQLLWPTAIWHMDHIDAGHHLEQFAVK